MTIAAAAPGSLPGAAASFWAWRAGWIGHRVRAQRGPMTGSAQSAKIDAAPMADCALFDHAVSAGKQRNIEGWVDKKKRKKE